MKHHETRSCCFACGQYRLFSVSQKSRLLTCHQLFYHLKSEKKKENMPNWADGTFWEHHDTWAQDWNFSNQLLKSTSTGYSINIHILPVCFRSILQNAVVSSFQIFLYYANLFLGLISASDSHDPERTRWLMDTSYAKLEPKSCRGTIEIVSCRILCYWPFRNTLAQLTFWDRKMILTLVLMSKQLVRSQCQTNIPKMRGNHAPLLPHLFFAHVCCFS